MAQAVGKWVQCAGLDPLYAVAREYQLAQHREIVEPMRGHSGQLITDERETLQLVQTGERARLDRADRTIAQLQAAQAVAEAEERVRGHAIDTQSCDLDPCGLVR